jgi:hypothetical protein
MTNGEMTLEPATGTKSWGKSTLSWSVPTYVTFPPWQASPYDPGNNQVDDKAWPNVGYDTVPGQSVEGGTVDVTIYAYWVDGTAHPYYLLILDLNSSWSPGELTVDSASSRGYGSLSVKLGVSVSVPGGATTLTPVGRTPATQTTSPQYILEVPASIVVGGQWEPFALGKEGIIPIEGWGVLDTTDPDNPASASWMFHQVEPWDPTVDDLGFDPATDGGVITPSWLGPLIANNQGTVPPLAPSSSGTFSVEMLAAWQAAPSTQQVTIEIVPSALYSLSLMHTAQGCYYGREHIAISEEGEAWEPAQVSLAGVLGQR